MVSIQFKGPSGRVGIFHLLMDQQSPSCCHACILGMGDIECRGFEVSLEREWRDVGVLLRIIHSIGCLDIAADTHELIVHVVPIVGGIHVTFVCWRSSLLA